MCKYNKEENKLLGLPEDTTCSLEDMYTSILADKEINEIIGLEVEEAEKNLNDYYNIKHIPKTLEEMEILKEKIREKYRNLLDKEPQCKPETIKACMEAEEALKT